MQLNLHKTNPKYFDDLVVKVILWAQSHVLEQYLTEPRSSFWTSALEAKVITQGEYDFAQNHYSHQNPNMWNQTMWNYVPDQQKDISND